MLADILLGIKESRKIELKNGKRKNMKKISLHIILYKYYFYIISSNVF